MNTPIRLQRSRKKGANLQAQSPDGRPVVYVGRPTRFGNPYDWRDWRENADRRYLESAVEVEAWCREMVVVSYIEWLREPCPEDPVPPSLADIEALRGKHLACWCAVHHRCHADVLLQLANEGEAGNPVAPDPDPA